MSIKRVEIPYGSQNLIIETGKLAKQANASVMITCGGTSVMVAVCMSKKARQGIDFFPLMVEFEEKLYAAGIIKGSRWIKREGRPTDEAILTGRMIDRSIRPLFQEDSRKDVQVVLTVLSADKENDHDMVGLVAASAALAVSGVNWDGPIGGIRVGRIDNKFVYNPTYEERAESDLDLIVAGTDKKVIMLEAGANEIKEDKMYDAIMQGQKELQGAIKLIKEMQKKVELKKPETKKEKLSEEEKTTIKEKEEIIKKANEWLKTNVNKILFDKS